MLDLRQYAALSFDVYGTLIDWEAGIAAVLGTWAQRHGADLSDEALLLAYADNEAAVERECPQLVYRSVTGRFSPHRQRFTTACERCRCTIFGPLRARLARVCRHR